MRNAEKTIAAAIKSILAQTYAEMELLIADDGSSDSSSAIVRSFDDRRICLVGHTDSRGIGHRLNELIGLSRGTYIARMDADDIALPERLATQVDYLDDHGTVDLVGSAVVVFRDNGQSSGIIAGPMSHEMICRRPCLGFVLPHPSWMGKREWFLAHPYQSCADGAEDQQLLFRTYRTSTFACLPDVLLGYRENARSLSKMWSRRMAFLAALGRQALDAGEYRMAACVLGAQIAKMAGDFGNLKFGIPMLRNKLAPVGSDIERHWQEVWRACNDEWNAG
jgi:glycosyltransferase involved in cell wall biosynthesis